MSNNGDAIKATAGDLSRMSEAAILHTFKDFRDWYDAFSSLNDVNKVHYMLHALNDFPNEVTISLPGPVITAAAVTILIESSPLFRPHRCVARLTAEHPFFDVFCMTFVTYRSNVPRAKLDFKLHSKDLIDAAPVELPKFLEVFPALLGLAAVLKADASAHNK